MAKRAGLWVEIGVNLALLTVLVSVLDAGVFYVVSHGVVEDVGADVAEGAAQTIANELSGAPEADWKRIVERHTQRGVMQVAVYGPGAHLVAGAGTEGDPAVQRLFFTKDVATTTEGDGVRTLAPVGPGRVGAVVEVRIHSPTVSRPIWAVILVHALVSAALIVVFGFTLFRRAVLFPIERMRDATRRIAAGELGTQVSEDAPRELADLAGSLNAMSAALRDYQARTTDQLDRLEAANQALTRTQEALVRSEKLASVGRLAAGLAHELGNPLAAVRGYVEILALGGNEAEEERELVSRARGEVERMHGLLRNLLDFAREERRIVGPVGVAGLLGEAAAVVRPQPAFRGVELRVEADPELIVEGEASKLHQALVNLLLNAGAAGARHVTLRAAALPTGVEITCVDDGEGIPPEHLGRIFDPFFTTRSPGAGTGLGLAIVYRIVEQHGGRIEVTSAVGQGASFRLTLDAVAAPTS